MPGVPGGPDKTRQLGEPELPVDHVDLSYLCPRGLHERLLVALHDAGPETGLDPVLDLQVELPEPVGVPVRREPGDGRVEPRVELRSDDRTRDRVAGSGLLGEDSGPVELGAEQLGLRRRPRSGGGGSGLLGVGARCLRTVGADQGSVDGLQATGGQRWQTAAGGCRVEEAAANLPWRRDAAELAGQGAEVAVGTDPEPPGAVDRQRDRGAVIAGLPVPGQVQRRWQRQVAAYLQAGVEDRDDARQVTLVGFEATRAEQPGQVSRGLGAAQPIQHRRAGVLRADDLRMRPTVGVVEGLQLAEEGVHNRWQPTFAGVQRPAAVLQHDQRQPRQQRRTVRRRGAHQPRQLRAVELDVREVGILGVRRTGDGIAPDDLPLIDAQDITGTAHLDRSDDDQRVLALGLHRERDLDVPAQRADRRLDDSADAGPHPGQEGVGAKEGVLGVEVRQRHRPVGIGHVARDVGQRFRHAPTPAPAHCADPTGRSATTRAAAVVVMAPASGVRSRVETTVT